MLAVVAGCNEGAKQGIAALDVVPKKVAADERYSGAFTALDGTWVGKFEIYVDTRGQRKGPRPTRVDPAALTKPPYKLRSRIDVTQHYVSQSPYFQRVTIVDRYSDAKGKVREVKSRGVNKVQGGQLWCVVKKPDDTVIHRGSLDGAHTIIWQRERRSPLAVEWFRETVRKDSYDIVGWGYYGSDNPALAPRMFFHARYTRPR